MPPLPSHSCCCADLEWDRGSIFSKNWAFLFLPPRLLNYFPLAVELSWAWKSEGVTNTACQCFPEPFSKPISLPKRETFAVLNYWWEIHHCLTQIVIHQEFHSLQMLACDGSHFRKEKEKSLHLYHSYYSMKKTLEVILPRNYLICGYLSPFVNDHLCLSLPNYWYQCRVQLLSPAVSLG